MDIITTESLTKIFDKFIEHHNWNLNKVRILTAIVFLNNAPLHHTEYAKFLFYLGKYLLWRELN